MSMKPPLTYVLLTLITLLGLGVFSSHFSLKKSQQSLLSYENQLLDQAKKRATIDSNNYNTPQSKGEEADNKTDSSHHKKTLPPPLSQKTYLQRPTILSRPIVQPKLPHHAP